MWYQTGTDIQGNSDSGKSVSGALLTLVGVGAAGMMMWYPRVVKVFEGVF